MKRPPWHIGLLPEYFADACGQMPAFRIRTGQDVRDICHDEVLFRTRKFTAALRKHGLAKGEAVCTILKRDYDWNCIDAAIARCGGIHIPFHQSSPETEFALKYFNKLLVIASDMPEEGVSPHHRFLHIDTLMELAAMQNGNHSDLNKAVDLSPNDVAMIVFSTDEHSSTTPYALSHQGIIENAWQGSCNLRIDEGALYLSLLPVAKSYERITQLAHQFIPSVIQYAEHHMLPSVNIALSGAASCSVVPAVFDFPVKVPEAYRAKYGGPSLAKLAQLPDDIVRDVFGSHFSHFLCGGAVLPQAILKKSMQAGLNIFEGYGLTQAAGGFVLNNPDAWKPGTLGKPFAHMEIKTSAQNEVLVKGSSVCSGRIDPNLQVHQVTDRNGWLHTSDLGTISGDGYLTLNGNLKRAFKLSNGYYYDPLTDEKWFENITGNRWMICRDEQGQIHGLTEGRLPDSERVAMIKEFRAGVSSLPMKSIVLLDVLPAERPWLLQIDTGWKDVITLR